jgi:hypothetical protein
LFSKKGATMKPSPKMQRIIQLLAKRHEVNLSEQGAYLHLTLQGYEPLVIESISPSRVVVAHYFIEQGDLVPDPRVTFFTTHPVGWIPIGVTQALGGSRTYAVLSDDGTKLLSLNRRSQADLAAFTEIWARNLRDQQWLLHGQPVLPPLFPLGQVVATPGALEALQSAGKDPQEYLQRHSQGDWGDLDPHDVQANQQALQDGDRLLSSYQVTDTLKVWIISEWDRSATTVMLPSEY